MPDSNSHSAVKRIAGDWNVADDHSLPGGTAERYVAAGVLIVRMRGDKVLADLCQIRNNAKSHADVKQIAEHIAAALNEAQEFPWEGMGPTPEEVGARTLWFWCSKTEEWLRATWEKAPGNEAWVNPTVGYAKTTASYWRRPPGAPACRLNEGEHIQEGTETSGDEVMGLGVLIDAPHGTVQYVPTDSPAAVEWAKYPCSASTSEDGWRVVVHYDDRIAPVTARDALRAAVAVLRSKAADQPETTTTRTEKEDMAPKTDLAQEFPWEGRGPSVEEVGSTHLWARVDPAAPPFAVRGSPFAVPLVAASWHSKLDGWITERGDILGEDWSPLTWQQRGRWDRHEDIQRGRLP